MFSMLFRDGKRCEKSRILLENVEKGRELKMKKLFMLLLALVGVLALTACSYEVTWEVNEDGSVKMTQRPWYSLDDMKQIMGLELKMSGGALNEDQQKEYDAIMKMESVDDFLEYVAATGGSVDDIITKEVDGVVYMSSDDDTEVEVYENPSAAGMPAEYVLTPDTIKMSFEDTFKQFDEMLSGTGDMTAEDLETIETLKSMVAYDFTITMPKEIIYTNGTLSKDKKSANFKFTMSDKDTSIYVFTADSKDVVSLSIGNSAYTKKKTVKISAPEKITSVTVNGKKSSGKKINTSKDGKYEVVVKTKNFEEAFIFVKDGTKPVVTGVENGKTYDGPVTITFSDELSGIKSAKLGKKKVKSGATISKAGKYTLKVTDNAGNKTTIKFTIK